MPMTRFGSILGHLDRLHGVGCRGGGMTGTCGKGDEEGCDGGSGSYVHNAGMLGVELVHCKESLRSALQCHKVNYNQR